MNIKKSDYIVCIAKITVKKEKLEDTLEIFAKLKKNSLKETGCLRYELHQNQDNPLIFTFIDRFSNMEAFNYHCAQEYTIKYFDQILPNLTDSMEFTLHNECTLPH